MEHSISAIKSNVILGSKIKFGEHFLRIRKVFWIDSEDAIQWFSGYAVIENEKSYFSRKYILNGYNRSYYINTYTINSKVFCQTHRLF